MVTKVADSKGRVTLGEKFANRTVLIEEVDETEVRVTLARVIPEREMWLHNNPKAKAMLLEGLEQAKAGKLTKGPDLAEARKIASQIPDDE